MNRKAVGIIAIVTAFIVIFSSASLYTYSRQPMAIKPQAASEFSSYLNETEPTGIGYFNASIFGSTAEFGYAFYLTGNSTTLSSGYTIGFQIVVTILAEKLSGPAGGFSTYITNAYADYGTQHLQQSNSTINFSGIEYFTPMNHLLSINGHFEVFTFSMGGSIATFYPTYNLSFAITPQLLLGPYAISGNSGTVADTLEVSS